MTIDFHLHIFEPNTVYEHAFEEMMDVNPLFEEFYREVNPYPDLMENFLKGEGLEHAVVFGTNEPASFGVTSNRYVSDYCMNNSFFIPFYCLDPLNSMRLANEIDRAYYDQGFKGIKILPSSSFFHPNSFEIYWVFKKAEELGLPVLMHTGTNNFRGVRNEFASCKYIEEVAVDFSNLKIILGHGGRGFEYHYAYYLTRQYRNVFLEISGLPPKKLLSYYPDLEKICEKVIFGTDWPGIPGKISENIKSIQSLPMSDGAIENILGKNAEKILLVK